ncbi:MAG: stage III sporulation AC/AD family protein [Lachnospiraceae bacterium]|nr:stage III sporulation AC/AD family protein [Lachnospiraceae bacterium]
MSELIKIAFLGIVGVLVAIQFKSVKPEYATYVGLAVSLIIFAFILRQVGALLYQFARVKEYLGGAEEYLAILLKVIGITYICEFSAGVCRDAGYQSVAGQIELLGKVSVMFAGIPILFATIEKIQQLL